MMRLREEALTDGSDDAVAAAEGMDQLFEQFMEETYIPVYEETQYGNWAPNSEPSKSGQCTKMNSDGTWETLSCTNPKMPPLCRRKKADGTFEFFVPATKTETGETDEMATGNNWKKMRAQCKAGSGEFTRPLSAEENESAMRAMNNATTYSVWLNLARKQSTQQNVSAHQQAHSST